MEKETGNTEGSSKRQASGCSRFRKKKESEMWNRRSKEESQAKMTQENERIK